MQHGNSSLSNDVTFASTRYRYEHVLSSSGSNGKCNLYKNSPELYIIVLGASEQSHYSSQAYEIDLMGLGNCFYFSDKQE